MSKTANNVSRNLSSNCFKIFDFPLAPRRRIYQLNCQKWSKKDWQVILETIMWVSLQESLFFTNSIKRNTGEELPEWLTFVVLLQDPCILHIPWKILHENVILREKKKDFCKKCITSKEHILSKNLEIFLQGKCIILQYLVRFLQVPCKKSMKWGMKKVLTIFRTKKVGSQRWK